MQNTIYSLRKVKRPMDLSRYLRVLSVFRSFDGEQNAYGMGWPTVFVRLSGCVGIYCTYCDTVYSWDLRRGRDVTPQVLMDFVKDAQGTKGLYGSDKVTITGGEPLQQDGPAFRSFVKMLLDDERAVTVETAGTEDVSWLAEAGVSIVADVKLQSSRARQPTHWDSLIKLSYNHVIKMVVADQLDLEGAINAIMFLRDKGCGARICVGPVEGSGMTLGRIVGWINDNQLMQEYGVGLNFQLHKVMFPDKFRDEEDTPEAKEFTHEKGN